MHIERVDLFNLWIFFDMMVFWEIMIDNPPSFEFIAPVRPDLISKFKKIFQQ